MADIDSIISGVSGNTRADFSGLAEIPKYYWEAKDQRAKNDLRDSFKGGVPTLPDGSIDYSKMQRTLYQKGALDQGNALSGIASRAGELEYLNRVDGPAPTVGPSTSRNSVTIDPSKRADASTTPAAPQQAAPRPQGQPAQQPTVMTVLAAQGIPNSELGKAAESIGRQLGIDPTAPLDLNDPQVRNVLAPAVAQIKRMGLGQVQQQPAAAPPQAAPSTLQATPTQVAAQNDPVLKRLTLLSASQDKQIAAAAKVRLEAYLKNQESTGTMKEYQKGVSQGFKGTLEDWQNRDADNTTQRDILTKSLIPRLEKSQENASAARNDIDAIHRSREELDRAGGAIFSGAFADKRLALAKVASLLGVPDSDRIEKTEAFSAAIGSRVAAMVKAFGSGTAISDGDRRFAQEMSGGRITLDEKSIRRILDIGERAGGLIIDRHNKQVDTTIGANEALKPARGSYIVAAPGDYKSPQAALPKLEPGKTKVNGLTYKGGNPRDKANWGS